MSGISKITKILKLGANRQEYFENPIYDYFNLNKSDVNVLLGEKSGSILKHVPDNYAYKGFYGYAIIRGLNCQAKCSYCYLQTYFKSPDIVRFTNIEYWLNFMEEFIKAFKKRYGNQKKLIFFDGDFQDSLGYVFLKENINQINHIINLIQRYDNVFLEIRTKCILKNKNFKNNQKSDIASKFNIYDDLVISPRVIYAITFSPNTYIKKYEIGSSDLTTRLDFARYICQRGGKIGVRIDPIIFDKNDIKDCLKIYTTLINQINQYINKDCIYNWAIGTLRIKEQLYKKLKQFGSSIVKNLIFENGFRKYPVDKRQQIYNSIKNLIQEDVFVCMDELG